MRIKPNWHKIERVVAFSANLATIVSLVFAFYLFRQEIIDRLFARPIVKYEFRAQGSSYKIMALRFFLMAKSGMAYTLIVRNHGREPALKVEVYVRANGTIQAVADDFSGLVLSRRFNILRQAGGIGDTWFLYEIERLPPARTFLIAFSRADECALDQAPTVTVRYENDKGEVFDAESEGTDDFEALKAGKVQGWFVDCEMPSFGEIARATQWTPDMVYYVRYWARGCGIEAELKDLERAMGRLAREYPRPRDFGSGGSGVVCERLSRALKE